MPHVFITFSYKSVMQILPKVLNTYLGIFSKLVSYYTFVRMASNTVDREMTNLGQVNCPLYCYFEVVEWQVPSMLPLHLVEYLTVSPWRVKSSSVPHPYPSSTTTWPTRGTQGWMSNITRMPCGKSLGITTWIQIH